MLIHSGTKPHSCDQCSSKFRHSGTLKSHKSLLHKNKQPLLPKEELKHNIDGEDDMSASTENTSTRRWKEKGPRTSAVKNPHITPSDNSSSEGEILDLTMSNHDNDRHNSLTPTETFGISGEFARWHSACSYMCTRCEEGGDYLKIYRHVSKVHGVKREMKPVVDFSAKIEYHMCFECKAIVKCDPYFITHHLKNKHRKTLSWYESKYKEALMNEKVSNRAP